MNAQRQKIALSFILHPTGNRSWKRDGELVEHGVAQFIIGFVQVRVIVVSQKQQLAHGYFSAWERAPVADARISLL